MEGPPVASPVAPSRCPPSKQRRARRDRQAKRTGIVAAITLIEHVLSAMRMWNGDHEFNVASIPDIIHDTKHDNASDAPAHSYTRHQLLAARTITSTLLDNKKSDDYSDERSISQYMIDIANTCFDRPLAFTTANTRMIQQHRQRKEQQMSRITQRELKKKR